MRTLCIIFLALTGVANTFGQCGTTQACRNQKFPYRFCPLVNGEIQVVCTDNPTNVPGKKPFRNVLPICARVITGPDDPQEVKMKDANGVDVVVYSPAQLQADLAARTNATLPLQLSGIGTILMLTSGAVPYRSAIGFGPPSCTPTESIVASTVPVAESTSSRRKTVVSNNRPVPVVHLTSDQL